MFGGDLAAIPDYALEPGSPDRAQTAHPTSQRNAASSDACDQRQPLTEGAPAGPERAEMARGRGVIPGRGDFEQRQRRSAGPSELQSGEVEKGPLSGQHRAA